MTPAELADGWLAGRTRVVLREYTDEGGNVWPAEPGTLRGPDSDGETRDAIIDADVWVVEVDEDHREPDDPYGMRGGVPASEVDWE